MFLTAAQSNVDLSSTVNFLAGGSQENWGQLDRLVTNSALAELGEKL